MVGDFAQPTDGRLKLRPRLRLGFKKSVSEITHRDKPTKLFAFNDWHVAMIGLRRVGEGHPEDTVPEIVQRVIASGAVPERTIIDEPVVGLDAGEIDARVVIEAVFSVLIDAIFG